MIRTFRKYIYIQETAVSLSPEETDNFVVEVGRARLAIIPVINNSQGWADQRHPGGGGNRDARGEEL